jgi:hypothetical protein
MLGHDSISLSRNSKKSAILPNLFSLCCHSNFTRAKSLLIPLLEQGTENIIVTIEPHQISILHICKSLQKSFWWTTYILLRLLPLFLSWFTKAIVGFYIFVYSDDLEQHPVGHFDIKTFGGWQWQIAHSFFYISAQYFSPFLPWISMSNTRWK